MRIISAETNEKNKISFLDSLIRIKLVKETRKMHSRKERSVLIEMRIKMLFTKTVYSLKMLLSANFY